MKRLKSLREIAEGQESGIIIYDDTEALVVNWSTYGPGELPRLISWSGLIATKPERPWHITRKTRIPDIKALLDGVDIVYDANDDLSDPDPIPGWVYETNIGATIIIPDGWN
jgi:hypothetical protein